MSNHPINVLLVFVLLMLPPIALAFNLWLSPAGTPNGWLTAVHATIFLASLAIMYYLLSLA